MVENKYNKGFTLIELMVAVIIFSVISVISYRTLASLVTTKDVIEAAQQKWTGVGNAVNWLDSAWNRSIPLVVRDENGILLPAIIGKDHLDGKFDSQVELTASGYIGDPTYGSLPPKRLGFRFADGKLYLVTWPVLNRVLTTEPRLDILMNNITGFEVNFLYSDRQWRPIWPPAGVNLDQMPLGLKVKITMKTGEEVVRQWSYQ